MSTYGNFLNVWSERYKYFDIYNIVPKVGSGFTVTYFGRKRGIVITTTRSKVISRGGIQTEEADYTLYTKEEILLKDKVVKYKGKWLRAAENGTWNEEGDFCITLLKQITGNVVEEEEQSVTEEVIQGEF